MLDAVNVRIAEHATSLYVSKSTKMCYAQLLSPVAVHCRE